MKYKFTLHKEFPYDIYGVWDLYPFNGYNFPGGKMLFSDNAANHQISFTESYNIIIKGVIIYSANIIQVTKDTIFLRDTKEYSILYTPDHHNMIIRYTKGSEVYLCKRVQK